MRFSAIYGALWNSRMPTKESLLIGVSEWADGLKEISNTQIKEALDKCRDPFGEYANHPPTLGQFVRMCYPSADELGLPTVEMAFSQAISSGAKHPLVEKTIGYIDPYTFRMLSEKEARQHFFPVYEQLRSREIKSCVSANELNLHLLNNAGGT